MSKQLPSKTFPKQIGRVDFNVDHFRRVILHNGLRVQWQQASECPCVSQGTGASLGLTLDPGLTNLAGLTEAAVLNCPSCKGRGYRHHSPQEIRALVQQVRSDPSRSTPQGDYASGTASITTLPEHKINWGDRLTVLDSVLRFRETVEYDGEATAQTRYPIVTQTLTTDPEQDVGVLDLYAADATGIAPLDNELVEGVDFTVTAEGAIAWVNPPALGVRWSISYYANPVYVVTDLPYPARDTWAKIKTSVPVRKSMPMRAVATLEFMASGEDAP